MACGIEGFASPCDKYLYRRYNRSFLPNLRMFVESRVHANNHNRVGLQNYDLSCLASKVSQSKDN